MQIERAKPAGGNGKAAPAPDGEAPPDDLCHVTDAVRFIPGKRRGKSVHVATLRRWIAKGWCRAYMIGGLLYVSVAELQELIRVREPTKPRPRPGGGPGM